MALITWVPVSWADEELFRASTLMEPASANTETLSVPLNANSMESTLGGPVAELGSTATGAFDFSLLVVLFFGIVGLIWARRHVHSL